MGHATYLVLSEKGVPLVVCKNQVVGIRLKRVKGTSFKEKVIIE